MKGLPIGIQTFSDIIEGNYLYVDKTREIYNLFMDKGKYYFLSRPRRFGKSLLVSTLKEIFLGHKELFRGLWIYDRIDWQPHPVLHIDFLGLNYASREELIDTLNYLINQNAGVHGISLKEKSYDKRFQELIIKLSRSGKVVVLVDEYDKPIIDFVDNREVAWVNRNILKGFYSTLKGLGEYIKFVFITGVSKFSKVSVFSDLNNLFDITLDAKYAAMLGYTHQELLHYFDDRLQELTGQGDAAGEEWVKDIKNWYNGYSWDGETFVYNPLSVLNFFQKKQFGNYWFESGTPSFLVKLIKQYHTDVRKLEHYRAGEAIFSSFDVDRIHVVSLLFQTGYLTIKEIQQTDRKKRFYILSYPNMEVKEALLEFLLADFSSRFADEIAVLVDELKESLERGEVDRFVEVVRSIFAQIPYDMFVKDREAYYQTVIYLILKLIGISIRAEVETNLGRVDAVVETGDFIYIMEFKMAAASAAINQIKEKKYYEQYAAAPKTVKLVGIGFDLDKRSIGDYLIEELPRH